MSFNNTTNSTALPPGPGARRPPQSPGFTTENIVATVFFVCLTIGIVFGNSLVIAAFKVNRRLRTTTNYFIMSLAVVDLMIGTFSVPLWVYFSITLDTRNSIYDFWLTFDIICGVSSILNMTMISLERCYALLRPMKHRNISKRYFIAGIVTAWFLAAFAGGMRKFVAVKPYYGFVVTSVFFFVPLVVILTAYGMIFHIARAHARGRGIRSFRKDLRIATTVAVVIGLFVLCWTPFFTFNFVFTYCGKFTTEIYKRVCAKIPLHVLLFNKWLQYGNSVCNPIIYGFRNNDFKKAFKNLLLRMCGRKVPRTRFDRSAYVRTARTAYVRSDSSFDESKSTIFGSGLSPPGMYDMRESYKKAMNNGRKKPIKVKQAKKRLADGLLAFNVEALNGQSGSNGYTTTSTNISSCSDVTSSASEAAKASDSDKHPEICPVAHANAACDLSDSENDRSGVSPLAQKSIQFLQTAGHVNKTFLSDDAVPCLVPGKDSPRRNRVHFESPGDNEDSKDGDQAPRVQDKLSVSPPPPLRQRKRRSHSDPAVGELQSEDPTRPLSAAARPNSSLI